MLQLSVVRWILQFMLLFYWRRWEEALYEFGCCSFSHIYLVVYFAFNGITPQTENMVWMYKWRYTRILICKTFWNRTDCLQQQKKKKKNENSFAHWGLPPSLLPTVSPPIIIIWPLKENKIVALKLRLFFSFFFFEKP